VASNGHHYFRQGEWDRFSADLIAMMSPSPLRQAVITATLDSRVTYVWSRPQATLVGSDLVWDLDDPGGEGVIVDFGVSAGEVGKYPVVSRVAARLDHDRMFGSSVIDIAVESVNVESRFGPTYLPFLTNGR
jgi:hypothetical protein